MTETTGTAYGLRSNILAFKPGASFEIALGRHFAWGGRAAAVVGGTQVSQEAGAPGHYTLGSGSLFGAEISPLLRWIPSTPGLQWSLVVPISYLVTSLPRTGTIQSISGTQDLGLGALLESRLTTRQIGVALRVGLMRSTDNLTWSVLGEYFL